jgi:hypothetical protein
MDRGLHRPTHHGCTCPFSLPRHVQRAWVEVGKLVLMKRRLKMPEIEDEDHEEEEICNRRHQRWGS